MQGHVTPALAVEMLGSPRTRLRATLCSSKHDRVTAFARSKKPWWRSGRGVQVAACDELPSTDECTEFRNHPVTLNAPILPLSSHIAPSSQSQAQMRPNATWSSTHGRLTQVLRVRALLPKHASILIAVSGGQDSLALAALLRDLAPHWHWRLAVAHCNHRWRADSDDNARYVRELSQQWGLMYLDATAESPPPNEKAAREWRYSVLADLAAGNGYGYVVTGHTASDRAETLILNLMRGSGADGLQALSWHRPLASHVLLVRPLLDFTRPDTAAFCKDAGLVVWEDVTNADLSYRRNRVRAELLPYLRAWFNPRADVALARTAELLSDDVEYLEAQAGALLQSCLHPTDAALHCTVLRAAPLALQRRVVRLFLGPRLSRAVKFEHVEKVLALLGSGAGRGSSTGSLAASGECWVEGEWLRFRRMVD